jgi:hypothetical protein
MLAVGLSHIYLIRDIELEFSPEILNAYKEGLGLARLRLLKGT